LLQTPSTYRGKENVILGTWGDITSTEISSNAVSELRPLTLSDPRSHEKPIYFFTVVLFLPIYLLLSLFSPIILIIFSF
jgi:hypothetical protein